MHEVVHRISGMRATLYIIRQPRPVATAVAQTKPYAVLSRPKLRAMANSVLAHRYTKIVYRITPIHVLYSSQV